MKEHINNIALLVAYYGSKPEFLRLFLHSCKFNKDIDFLLFTDWDTSDLLKADNIFYIHSSLREFNELASKKTGLPDLSIISGYKLCDLKPAWPHIFEDYTEKYEFVGYCDIDLIFGRITNFFNQKIQEKSDIFSVTVEYLSGALSIFRNNEKIRRFYQRATGWEYIFQDSRHWAFDEYLRIDSLKKIDADRNNLQSFSDCVFAKRDDVRLTNYSYVGYEKRPLLVIYDNGKVFSEDREWIFFHYVIAKQTPFWVIPNWIQIPTKFFVNKYGFFTDINKPVKFISLLYGKHNLKQVSRGCRSKFHTVRALIRNAEIKVIFESIIKQFS